MIQRIRSVWDFRIKIKNHLVRIIIYSLFLLICSASFFLIVSSENQNKRALAEASVLEANQAKFNTMLALWTNLKKKDLEYRTEGVDTSNLDAQFGQIIDLLFLEENYEKSEDLINSTETSMETLYYEFTINKDEEKTAAEAMAAAEAASQQQLALNSNNNNSSTQKPVVKGAKTTNGASAPTPTTSPSVVAPPSAPPPVTPPPAPAPTTAREQFLVLINDYRATLGLGKLSLDTMLNNAAQKHSEWMKSTKVFDHTGENGSLPWDRCRAAGTSCYGEIISMSMSIQGAFSGWQKSSGHNAIMINPKHKKIGVGIAGNYYTVVFQ